MVNPLFITISMAISYGFGNRVVTINGLVFTEKITGKPHDLHGKIDGFRLRFSRENPSIETCYYRF